MNYDASCDTAGVATDVARENEERLQRIVAEIEADGKVTTATLAQTLQVTPRTIQRDLEALKAAGRIQRVGSTRYGQWVVVQ